MTKEQEYQAFSNYLGMSPKAYVARGLALKRAVELGGTEVGVGGPPPEGESTSPIPLPTKFSKRCTRFENYDGKGNPIRCWAWLDESGDDVGGLNHPTMHTSKSLARDIEYALILKSLPPKKTKRLRYLPSGEVFSICVSCEGYKNHLIDGKCEDCR